MEDLSKYHGVIIEPLSDTDFIAGATSPLKLELRNQTYDWLQFFSAGERQSFAWGDSQGCVSFTAVHHLVATQLNWMLTNGLLPKATVDFLKGANGQQVSYIVDGKINLSERFIVSLSGTTTQGNSAQNVLQAIRKCGIVPESSCPNDGPTSREEYMTVSAGAKSLGEESLKYFTFFWQSVPKNLIKTYLVQAPVMIFTAVCPGWGGTSVIQACQQEIVHATGVYAVDFMSKNFRIFDQYTPFEKTLAAAYLIPYAFQLIVYPIPQGSQVERHDFDKNINQSSKIPGEASTEVQFLQTRLGIPPTGIYDQTTADAVLNFQLTELPKRGLASIWELLWLHGRAVGPKTRKVLNEI